MSKIYKFSKLFFVAIILSLALIGAGIFGMYTKGLNLGIDFQAGYIAKIKLAPTALKITYIGPKNVSFSQDDKGLYLVITSVDSENEVETFLFAEYGTLGSFVQKASELEGLSVTLIGDASVQLSSVFAGSQQLSRLSEKPFVLHYSDDSLPVVSADQVRNTLASIKGISVQQVGTPKDRTFQLRLRDDGKTENSSEVLNRKLTTALNAAYGNDNFAYLSTDFAGSQYSSSLVRQSVILVLFAVVLIFLYVMIRFKWDFAMASVLALIHDVTIMTAFIVWMQIEFSTLVVAALLTIIGYSINNTVVLFDRVRENTRLFPNLIGVEILNRSLSAVLGRSIITSLTTLSAMVALYIFTTGGIQNFALALIVGIVIGAYSSLFIAPAILSFTCGKKKGTAIIKFKKPGQSSGAIV
ncbi:MAG: protein translocase subunit SecF [Treponema sp.]|nr:MAG: protein translocase subunit SecF [Treponema sp.]